MKVLKNGALLSREKPLCQSQIDFFPPLLLKETMCMPEAKEASINLEAYYSEDSVHSNR